MNWKYIFNELIDFLFPRSGEEMALASLSLEDLALKKRVHSPASGVYALLNYRDPTVRRMIWELKYRGSKHCARLFAELLYDELVELISDEALFNSVSKVVLIAIPLSKKRQRERGWNQSERILTELVKLDNSSMFTLPQNVLKKIRHTKSQTQTKNRAERLLNQKGAFTVRNPDVIRGTLVILVDDVTTTGATLREAKQMLKHAGAKKVLAFALAH